MMKKLFCSFVCLLGLASGANAAFTSCGPGYIMTSHAKIDGINAVQCQKLWCRDLETGKPMGSGNNANSGYKVSSAPVELTDVKGNRIECWGERRWCGGEVPGEWNPEYGAYTRGGDNATFLSYQKGSCFAWRLEKPECDDGQTAVLQNGQWVCGKSSGSATASRATSVRRTGTLRRTRN